MLDENDKNYLRSIPGAMEAWEGTRTWEAKLRVCGISGTHVKILPTIAAEYAHAPPSVKELLQQIEKKHNEEYADILKSKLAEVSGNAPQPPQDDPRPSDTKGDDTGPGGDATAAILNSLDQKVTLSSGSSRRLLVMSNCLTTGQFHSWFLKKAMPGCS